jgi:proline iminopeptidase
VLVEVNGTTLWYEVHERTPGHAGAPTITPPPTVILVHGGPGTWDHSYLRPLVPALVGHARVVLLDLRDHGRSSRGDPDRWSFEACADDLPAFCAALGIERPIVLGHWIGCASWTSSAN